MTELTVSVVIPTIPGRETMLARAMESVRAQQRRPDDLIIQHDYSLEGVATTRNRALEAVETDLVAWLDDDDELLPNHLLRLVRVLENYPHFDLVYPIPEIPVGRDPTAVSVGGRWIKPWGVPFGLEQEVHLRVQGNFIPITHVVRTSKVRQVGGFPQPGEVRWIEDWGYLVKLLDAGARFHHLPAVTWRWHIHDQHTGGFPDRARTVSGETP